MQRPTEHNATYRSLDANYKVGYAVQVSAYYPQDPSNRYYEGLYFFETPAAAGAALQAAQPDEDYASDLTLDRSRVIESPVLVPRARPYATVAELEAARERALSQVTQRHEPPPPQYHKATVHLLVAAAEPSGAAETISEALRNLCLDDGSSGFVAWEYADSPHPVATDAVAAYAPDLYDVPLANLEPSQT